MYKSSYAGPFPGLSAAEKLEKITQNNNEQRNVVTTLRRIASRNKTREKLVRQYLFY